MNAHLNRWFSLVALCVLAALSGNVSAQSCSSSGTEGGIAVYRVGTGCACSSIQQAVSSIPNNGTGIVRIRSGSYSGAVSFANKSVRLIGGHTSCTATAPTPFGLSAINAAGSNAPALGMYTASGARELRLRNINLVNGTGVIALFAPFPGGGLSVRTEAGHTTTVTLENSAIFDNSSVYRGGGVVLDGPGNTTMFLRNNSRIFSNVVTGDNPRGGGLFCEGNHHIVMQGGSINTNVASSLDGNFGRGGGIHLDGCSMIWFSDPPPAGASSNDASLRNNVVYGHGGGLYATGGASVLMLGADDAGVGVVSSSRPLRIHGNESRRLGDLTGGGGGGFYVQGAGTTVTVDRGWTYSNVAGTAGGAAYVAESATLNVERSVATCHNPRLCSRLFDNRSGTGGGAIFAWNQSQANIRRTRIENNRNGSGGTAVGNGVLAAATNATVLIRDSLIFGSTSSGHALAANGGQITLQNSTIADTRPGSFFGVIGLNGAATLNIYDSIIHETGPGNHPIVRVHDGTPSVDIDCVVWHDDALVALGTPNRTQVADPLFADRAKNLYYLRRGSPAINACNFAPPPPAFDLDWNPRGLCHSTNEPCGADVYDLGAYELPLEIFRDRFE